MATTPQVYEVNVKNIQDFGNETKHFEFYFDPGQSIDFKAGQFISILLPHEGKVVRRAYSIASPPAVKEHIDFVVKRVEGGLVTNWFFGLKEGDRTKIQGPYGKFVLPESVTEDLAFVATGTGIAPFRAMIPTLLQNGFQKKIWLIFGARYDNMIPYHQEWLDLAKKYPNFNYMPTISRPTPAWRGETGYVQTKIEKFLSNPEGKTVFICGLNEMITAVQEACLKKGFTKEQILFERYD